MRIITHSQMQRYRDCPRRYYYEYVRRLRPVTDALALRHGSFQHEALDDLATGGLEYALERLALRKNFLPEEAYLSATVAATTRAYSEYQCPIVKEVLLSEVLFEMPLRSPDGKRSRTWKLGGKMDQIVALIDNRNALMETKTIDEAPDDRYFLRLMMDPQVSLYLIAAQNTFPHLNVETIIYNVIRKPSMGPKKATPIEDRKYTKEGKLYANQREYDETAVEWHDRLLEDIRQRPSFYFCRKEVPRLMAELDVFSAECWDWAKLIRESELANRWGRNVTRNCEWCPHFMHCVGVVDLEQDPVPAGFRIVDNEHPELEQKRANTNTFASPERNDGPEATDGGPEHLQGGIEAPS